MNVDRGVVGEEGVVGGLVSKQPQACGGTQLQIGKPIPRAHMSDYLELVNARVEQCMSPFGEWRLVQQVLLVRACTRLIVNPLVTTCC